MSFDEKRNLENQLADVERQLEFERNRLEKVSEWILLAEQDEGSLISTLDHALHPAAFDNMRSGTPLELASRIAQARGAISVLSENKRLWERDHKLTEIKKRDIESSLRRFRD